MKNSFKWLVGLSAVLVAFVGASFSVTGLQSLYSGSEWAIFAFIALEIGKLVTAAALHRHWSTINNLMKAYLTGAVVILVLITSAGIFGYLTEGYQEQIGDYEKLQNQKATYTTQIDRLQQRQDEIDQQIQNRTQRAEREEEQIQEEIDQLMEERRNLPDNYVTMRRNIDKQIEQKRAQLNDRFDATDLRAQKDTLFSNIQALQDSVTSIENKQITTGGDVGPLIYISRFFDVPMDTVTMIFTSVIVLVFDPLAVCLVIVFVSVLPKNNDEEDDNGGKLEVKGNVSVEAESDENDKSVEDKPRKVDFSDLSSKDKSTETKEDSDVDKSSENDDVEEQEDHQTNKSVYLGNTTDKQIKSIVDGITKENS